MAPLLATLPRLTTGENKGNFSWRTVHERQYKSINSNLSTVRQLLFRFQDEYGRGFNSLSDIRITLHFVSK